jgi:hypothetical protein
MHIRLGRVIKVNYTANTVDILFDNGGGGVVHEAVVTSSLAATTAGSFELPVLNTITEQSKLFDFANPNSFDPTTFPNLVSSENKKEGKVDIDDPTLNYAYAIVSPLDKGVGQSNWVCLGFVFPFRNQVLFDPENIDKTSPQLVDYVRKAIKKMRGGYMHRTNSDVYWVVDIDGNMEWTHPNGSFMRIAETPTIEEDGAIHVDLTNGSRKSYLGGNLSNLAWNTSRKKGSDGNLNSERKVYGHIELVTEQGTIAIDISKTTGDITIKTPVDASNATKTNNKLTIICGGDAILESVQGDVKIQSVNGDTNIEAKNTISVSTDGANHNSITLAPNGSFVDNLVYLHKLIDKFNNHKHVCNHTGQMSSTPDKSLDESDGTSVTTSG